MYSLVPKSGNESLVVQSKLGDRHSKLGPPKRISWPSRVGIIATSVGYCKYFGNLLQQKGYLQKPVDMCDDMESWFDTIIVKKEKIIGHTDVSKRYKVIEVNGLETIHRKDVKVRDIVVGEDKLLLDNYETLLDVCQGNSGLSYDTMSNEAKLLLEPEGAAFQFSKDHYDQWKKSTAFTRIIARFLYGEDGSKVNKHSGMLCVALIGLMCAKETINTKKRDKEVEEIEKLLCFNEAQSQDISIMIRDCDENSTYTNIKRIESSMITSADVTLKITDEDNNEYHTNSNTNSKDEAKIIRENKRNDKNPKVKNDKKSKIETISPIQAIKNHWRQHNGKDDLYVPLEFDGHGKEPTIFLIKFEKKMLNHFFKKVGDSKLIHNALKSCRGKARNSAGLVWDKHKKTLKLRPSGGQVDMRYLAEYEGKQTKGDVVCYFFNFNTHGVSH